MGTNKIAKLDHSSREGHGDESENTVHVKKGTYMQVGTVAPDPRNVGTYGPNRKTGTPHGTDAEY